MTRYLLAILLLGCAFFAAAQPCSNMRYQERVFGQSYVTSNVVYGNAPSLTTVYLGENVTQNVNLTMDIFEPFGDTLAKRPLVVLAFGGAFLIGSKEDGDIQSVCDSLARRGYVTASINYRLGMNVVDGTSAERAIYRSLQDFSAAIRYLKEYADLYRIDTNYIYAGGVSAGGFAALHMAFMDEADRLPSSFGAGGFSPRPDLGCKDCSGNNFAHSTKVRGIVSFWGAIGDVNFIKPTNVLPLVSFHGDQDLIVPYGTGFPFTALFVLPEVSGSATIKQRYDQLGAYNDLTTFAGVGHNIWGLTVTNNFTPNQYFQPIYRHTADFLFEQTRPDKPIIAGADTICQGITATYTISAAAGLKYCWQAVGGQITAQSGNIMNVIWQSPGNGYLMATTVNHLDAVSATDTFSVWVNTPVGANIAFAESDTVCSGGSLMVTANTVATNFQWSPANYYADATADTTILTPLISGLYFLQVEDGNGCIVRDSAYVTVLPSPLAPTIVQQADSILASGIGTINWYDADSNLVYSGSSFTPTANGIYFAVETSTNGCESWSTAFEYLQTGLLDLRQTQVNVYPNPFSDRVVVRSSQAGILTVYDVSGAVVGITVVNGNTTINLAALAAGMYYYELTTNHGKARGKLLKQ
jgi:acetyl esterase/lipase